MESDDSAVSRAAHLMVGTLAGSLAHVTSKVFLHKVHGCSFQLYIQSQHAICCITPYFTVLFCTAGASSCCFVVSSSKSHSEPE
jgi:hypothetical protein